MRASFVFVPIIAAVLLIVGFLTGQGLNKKYYKEQERWDRYYADKGPVPDMRNCENTSFVEDRNSRKD